MEVFFQRTDGVSAVVKDRRCQRGVGFTFRQDTNEVVGLPGSARGNHWDACSAGNGPGECAVKPALDTIGIHGGEKNFARSKGFTAGGPLDGVNAFIVAARS